MTVRNVLLELVGTHGTSFAREKASEWGETLEEIYHCTGSYMAHRLGAEVQEAANEILTLEGESSFSIGESHDQR